MSFSLSQMRTFVALAEWRSASRAAVELGISQPAISKNLAALERAAGVPLLVKLPRGLRLTEAGEALLAHSRGIVGAVQSAESDLAGYRNSTRGTLRIAASTTIARYVVPGLLHEFLHRHPAVSVRLDSMHSRFVAKLLLDRQVDIGLVEAPVRHVQLRVTPWLDEAVVIVAGAAHPLTRREKVAPGALSGELLLLREPGSGAHAVAIASLSELGGLPARRAIIDCHEAIKQMLALGTGIAVMPERSVADQLKRGVLRVIPLEGWRVFRQFSRLTAVGRRASVLARAFESVLTESASRSPSTS